jgi:FkbM family methyltransferase
MLDLMRRAVATARRPGRRTYAQAGEDVLIENALERLAISHITYLDVGAHHPTWLSNTYLLYLNGGQGVCVDPDPEACALLRRVRPRDHVIEAAVASAPGRARFYATSDRSHGTLSPGNAAIAGNVDQVIEVDVITLEQAAVTLPNVAVLSLDIEGLDLEVLRATDLTRFRPAIICTETLAHAAPHKPATFAALLRASSYFAYADTFFNTIFVDNIRWEALNGPGYH